MNLSTVCHVLCSNIEVQSGEFVEEGGWDSISVVEVHESPADRSRATYKLTTTIMLSMGVNKAEVGSTNLSGSLTRQVGLLMLAHESCPVFLCVLLCDDITFMQQSMCN